VDEDYVTRVATIEDAAAVEALLEASYPVFMGPWYEEAVLVPALEVVTKANHALLASGTYYVAESRDGCMIGCGGWTRERPGIGDIAAKLGHVRHFGTHPAWTRRGVGRAIYRLCQASARAVGIDAFECYSSLNAEGFYSTLGFRRIRIVLVELRPNLSLPSVWMRRQI
jgi:N-acetylglutamate synthase-like GNAT family acetyltransferase